MAENRPDLAALEVNDPFSYQGFEIFPAFRVPQKIGRLYWMNVVADAAAQTGRTLGAAPTSATMANNSDTYTCAEVIDRVIVPDDEVPLWGGTVEAAEKNAAIVGIRNVRRAIEDAQIGQAESTTITGQDILTSLLKGIDAAVDAVHQVPGKLCGICGWTTFRRITRYTEVTNTLLRTLSGGQLTGSGEVRLVTMDIVAQILGLQKLFVGDSDHYTAGQMTIFKQADPNMLPLQEAQVGRTLQYWPTDDGPIQVETFFNDELKAYTVDVRMWYLTKRLASRAGCFILKGIDEGNAVTTTATTTTTTTA